MTEPLSVRTYRSALRMSESEEAVGRMARPKLEDFADLDLAPAQPVEAPAPSPAVRPVDDAAVRAVLERMQEASRVPFADSGGDAA